MAQITCSYHSPDSEIQRSDCHHMQGQIQEVAPFLQGCAYVRANATALKVSYGVLNVTHLIGLM